jgi:IS5 family transposase
LTSSTDLKRLGDQLETFRSAVDFELFRPVLTAALSYTDRTEGRRPPFDPVLMFKILVIQAANILSDDAPNFSSMTGRCLCGS